MLTADELCQICGTTLAQRRGWAKVGDLRQRQGFEELDAVELATYARLRDAAGPKRAKAAWRELRAPLQEHLLKPPHRLWMVIEVSGVESHDLTTRPAGLSKRVEHGRPVIVVDLYRIIEDARSAYRAAASRKRRSEVGQVRQLRSGG